MTLEKENADSILKRVLFFDCLDLNEQNILLKHIIYRICPKRTPLFLEGDTAHKYFVILKGWIKLYSITDEGEEVVVDMLTSGDVLGDIAVVCEKPYVFSAVVAEDAQIAEIPADTLRQRIKENTALAKNIMTLMTQKIKALRTQKSRLASMSAEQRLGCLLLQFSSWMVGNGGTFLLPYDKSIIAAQIGVEPATLSRLFKKLENKGVCKKGSEIHIKDFALLSSYCSRYCSALECSCMNRHQPDRVSYENIRTAA